MLTDAVTIVAAYALGSIPIATASVNISSPCLVPWNRDSWDKSRSAAPGRPGATTEHIGNM